MVRKKGVRFFLVLNKMLRKQNPSDIDKNAVVKERVTISKNNAPQNIVCRNNMSLMYVVSSKVFVIWEARQRSRADSNIY